MTGAIWANILLAFPFLLAFMAVPLWLTYKRPQTPPNHSQARAYLRAKAALAEAAPVTSARAPAPQRAPAAPQRRAADRVTAAA